MGRKKLHKNSMMGFLVGYESGNIYCIYHPAMKEFKVSWDVIFSEKQFFDIRRIEMSDLEIDGDKESEMEDGGIQSAASEAGQ